MSAPERYRIPEAPDWRGNLIVEGATVLYPRMSGRSVEMREATVLEIWRRNEDRRIFRWGAPPEERLGTAPQYVFKLQPNGRGSREFHAGEGPVWIQNGENVTALDVA